MRHEVQQRDKIKVLTEIVVSGSGQTGLSPTALLKRVSDGLYWSGAAWQASPSSNAMTEVDSSNQPGLYRLSLPSGGIDPVLGASGYEAVIVETTLSLRENLFIDVYEEVTTDPLDEGKPSPTVVDARLVLQPGTSGKINISIETTPSTSGKVGAFLFPEIDADVGASSISVISLSSYQAPDMVELARRDDTVSLVSVTGSPTFSSEGGPGGEDVMLIPVDDSSSYSVGNFVRAASKLGGGHVYKILAIGSGTQISLHANNTVAFDIVNGDSLELVDPTGVYSGYVQFDVDDVLTADSSSARMRISCVTRTTASYDGPKFSIETEIPFSRTIELDLSGLSFRTG